MNEVSKKFLIYFRRDPSASMKRGKELEQFSLNKIEEVEYKTFRMV